jgi:multidrug resistance efflux pump
VLPAVHEGQHAVARLDGYPDRPIPGQVVAISPRAEFTPFTLALVVLSVVRFRRTIE